MKRNRLFFYQILTLAAFSAFSAPRSPVPTGAGNFVNGTLDDRAIEKMQALAAMGATHLRVNLYPSAYYQNGKGVAEKLDGFILKAHEQGITPIILFELYHEYTSPPRDSATWFEVGNSFAKRFAPNSSWLISQGIKNWGIEMFEAINEPDLPGIITKEEYHNMLSGLADGVHKSYSKGKVFPGGYMAENAFGDHTIKGYLPAIADLLNSGKLDGIDLHTYNDAKLAPIEKVVGSGNFFWNFSPQSDFDEVKKASGITRDIQFYATEFGFKGNSQDISEEYAAKRMFTCVFANFGIVGNDKKTPVTKFALPWQVFALDSSDKIYGMAKSMQPYKPNLKGEAYQAAISLISETKLIEADPYSKGEYYYKGSEKNVIVWNNLPKWTQNPGKERDLNVPDQAKILRIHQWNTLTKGPMKIVSVKGMKTITVTNLPEAETLVFEFLLTTTSISLVQDQKIPQKPHIHSFIGILSPNQSYKSVLGRSVLPK